MTQTAEVVCVYGIVPAGRAAAVSEFDTVVHGPLAAVIGAAHRDRPLGADDLRSHDAAVAAFVQAGVPILPMRFGSAVADREAVAEQVLAPRASALAAALDDLSGHAEFLLKVRYDQDAVLRRIVRDDPAVADARAAVRAGRGNPQAAQLELGRRVAAALERRRPGDADTIRDALVPRAREVHCALAEDAWGVADLACLVAAAQQDEFLAVAEELAEQHAGLMHLRLLGPLAPYDFVPDF